MNAGIRRLPLTLILLLLAAAGGLTIYNGTAAAAGAMGASVQRAGHRRRAANAVPLQPAAAVDGVAVGRRRPGLVGVLFQQVLRNPLAEPSTLGVAAGAQLGLTIATLWVLPGASSLASWPPWWARLWWAGWCSASLGQADVAGDADSGRAGAGAVLRRGQQPVGAVSLRSAAGHVPVGNRCAEPTGLERRAVHSAAFAGGRPAGGTVAAPADAAGAGRWCGAQPGLGLSMARFCTTGLAIIFSAMLVSAVGVIGFIGLFAPLMAKMLGARARRTA